MGGNFIPESELNLKGYQKYFNTYTLRGKFNIVVTTYSSILLGILYYKYRSYKKKALSKASDTTELVNMT